jgi:ATP/ADP translocase
MQCCCLPDRHCLHAASMQTGCSRMAGKLVSHLPPRMVFYASVVPLVAFYAFFAGALYPASAYLHPHGFYERMAPLLPIGLHGLLKVACHAVTT